MKKIAILLITVTLAVSIPALSQKKLRISGLTGLGTSYFRGSGTVNSSVFLRHSLGFPDIRFPDTMANSYGRKPFTNFMAGLDADIVFPSKWILQLSSQYEYTGARMTIDSVISPTGSIKTNGTYTRFYDLISLNPQIGRIIFQNPSFEFILHTGIDYIINISLGERSDYKNEQDGKHYSIGGSGGDPEVNDFRITAGATLMINRVGIDINYKHGIANYKQYGTGDVYSRLIHVRFIYTFFNRSI